VKPIPITRFPKIDMTARSVALLILVFFSGSSPLRAQSKSLSAEKRAQAEKAALSFMAANSVPGISLAVVRDGELVWPQHFGMAENFVPATSSTPFRLRSISKPITLPPRTSASKISLGKRPEQ